MESFITGLSSFFIWLLVSSMQVSVLVCIILAIKAVARGRLAVRWHYWLWLVLLARMAMPWAPESSFSVFTLVAQAKRAFVTKHIAEMTPPAVTVDVTPKATNLLKDHEPVESAETMPQAAQVPAGLLSFEVVDVLSLLWLIVALGLAVFALACNFRLWGIVKSQRPLTDSRILDLLQDCKARMDIRTILEVVVTDKVKSPALFGVVRPRLLLPEGVLETLSVDELRYVFLHELAHLKRRDIYLGWLVVVLQILHWFNPLVWFAFHRMRADRELACDGLVLTTMGPDQSQAYGQTLVNLFKGFSQIQYVPGIAGILENKSQLKRRITMIARFKKGSYRWSVLAIVLLAVLSCVVLTNAQGTTQAENKEPATLAPMARASGEKGSVKSSIEVTDILFEPIHQGKNVVRVKVKNKSDNSEVFAIHIYTRSVDYGHLGVGWGRHFFETIKAGETRQYRFVYKIHGPITDNTWLRLKFYNPESLEAYDYEKPFKTQRYSGGDLKWKETKENHIVAASSAQVGVIMTTFKEIQKHIKGQNYKQAWELFTADYRETDFHNDLKRFKETMEPKHPIQSAFWWEKEDFLKLQPISVARRNGALILTAGFEEQNWTIDFVKEDGAWKIDWISGYRPAILDMQEEDKRKAEEAKKKAEEYERKAEEIVLTPETEELLQSFGLTSPDVIRDVRTLFQYTDRVTSDQALYIVNKLMTDRRPEARRAAADLLACSNNIVRGLVIRCMPMTGEEAEYFLTNIVEWWDNFWDKERAALQYSLPQVLRFNKGNARIEDLVDEITALMISHSGKMVPLAGIELAKKLNLESDRIAAALEGQRDNPIYDYFDNEHPVKKAALEFLGEEYVPPTREQVDYSQISVAKEMQLERSGGLTVGILTSLYTATGPSYYGTGTYAWRLQCNLFPVFGDRGIDTRIYFHPITQVENSPLRDKLRSAGLDDTVLNSASSYDLSMCDVIVLSGIYNLRPEVVDALENFVWNGGGIITIDAAGIVSCPASKKFAALQDMKNLEWGWNYILDQTLLQITETPLTHGIDLSLPVKTPGRAFDKNSYTFSSSKYDDQILLCFEPDGAVALRVSTYGDGRIAHFGWFHWFKADEIGERNWQLFHRVLRWAAGQDYKDLRPKPAYSKKRYKDAKGIFGRIVNALK